MINNRVIDIDELKNYRGYSVDELIEIIKEKEDDRRTTEREREQNEREWFKNLIGRFFIIDFNGFSYCVVHVVNDIRSNARGNMTKQPTYEIHYGKGEFMIKFENRDINNCWYNNPYETDYYGKGQTKITEITEEQWNDIEKLYRASKAMFEANEILNKK